MLRRKPCEIHYFTGQAGLAHSKNLTYSSRIDPMEVSRANGLSKRVNDEAMRLDIMFAVIGALFGSCLMSSCSTADGVATASPVSPWLLIIPLELAGLLALASIVLYTWNKSLRAKMARQRKQLTESQQKYWSLMDSVNDAIFIMTAGEGDLLDANSRSVELTGYSKEELLRMRMRDLFPEGERDRALEEFRRVLLMGSGNFGKMTIVRKDGDFVPVDISARVVEYEGRKLIQNIMRNVTEKKRMEEEISRRNRDLSTLNALAASVSQSLDLEEIMHDALDMMLALVETEVGIIHLINEGGESLEMRAHKGLSQRFVREASRIEVGQEVIGLVAQSEQIIVEQDLPHASRPFSPLAEEGIRSFVSLPMRAKERTLGVISIGSRYPNHGFSPQDVELLIAASNQIGIAVENARLFRKLKETVSNLLTMKQFNENILQSMTSGVLTVDLEGKTTSFNKAAEAILGYRSHQVIGLTVQEVFGPKSELPSIITKILQTGIPYSRREMTMPRQDGQNIPAGTVISVLRNDGGLVAGAIVVFSDLSEMKAMQEEKQRLDRLAALGEMAAVVAHEIRNPLAGIAAGIQYLAGKFGPDDPLCKSVELILSESTRLNQLIEDILLVSRPPQLHRVPCYITDVLDSTLSHWEAQATTQGITIERYYAPYLPPVQADVLRLERVFSNIMSNAVEAMPQGGRLRIAVRRCQNDEMERSNNHGQSKGYLEVEIADTGVGISAHLLEKIFEPFFTTKTKGTGLGLTIASRIITEHGGKISVRSQEGRGTTFSIKLPVAG